VKIKSAVTAINTHSSFSPVTAKIVPEKALKGSFISQQVTYVTPITVTLPVAKENIG